MVTAVHVAHGGLLVGAGAVFGLLAVTARGPLGIVRVCGPRLHAVLDITAGVLIALSPLVRPLRPGAVGIVVVEVVAVAWLRVSMLTADTTPTLSPAATGADGAAPSGLPGTQPGGAHAPPGPVPSAFRAVGRLTAGARNRLPATKTTLDSRARRVGLQTGRVQRAWRRTTR